MSDSALSIGLFYGSTTCYTEMAAEKIQAQLNSLFDEFSTKILLTFTTLKTLT